MSSRFLLRQCVSSHCPDASRFDKAREQSHHRRWEGVETHNMKWDMAEPNFEMLICCFANGKDTAVSLLSHQFHRLYDLKWQMRDFGLDVARDERFVKRFTEMSRAKWKECNEKGRLTLFNYWAYTEQRKSHILVMKLCLLEFFRSNWSIQFLLLAKMKLVCLFKWLPTTD
jgi:hypothetical protein